MGSGVRTVLVTAPDAATAEELATAVVGEGLAACANLIPGVVSIYRWEGKLQRDAEVLLVLKTTVERCAALTERVLALHPYQIPEVLSLPVESGSEGYLRWVQGEVSPRP